MKTVNPFLLHELLAPITGLADDAVAVEAYSRLDTNDERQIKEVIRRELKPYYCSLNEQVRKRAKFALSYYLSKPSADFARVFESCLPPFDPPDDARQFFVWLWEEFFPTECFELQTLREIKEVANIHEPNRYS